MEVNVLADAIAAKRHGCPECGTRADVACTQFVNGGRRLTLIETHQKRLALVNERYEREDPRVDAEG